LQCFRKLSFERLLAEKINRVVKDYYYGLFDKDIFCPILSTTNKDYNYGKVMVALMGKVQAKVYQNII